MARSPGVELFAAVSLCVALPLPLAAQGGWRAWDLYLRDGTRIEANPFGAPDDNRLAISVGGMEERGHDRTIPRRRIALIAAQTTVGPRREPIPGDTLPPRPTGRTCEDVIVLRDGRKTTGHVWLTRVRYSAGVVRQRGVEIELDSIAYIQFADPTRTRCKPSTRRGPRSYDGQP
jgi:hypothetical protein